MSIVPERPVLVAPDSFKGTFRAAEVAGAIGRGLERAGLMPPDLCPLADGGEGTMEALLLALGGEAIAADVHDPLGRPVRASFGLVEDGGTAVIEMAAASGLGLVAESERDPWAASTYGTGELICAAVAAGADVVVLGVGGSATTDGGAGALEAIEEHGGLAGARLVVLTDVRTPFERAPAVFGPQKGADPDTVRVLEQRLSDWAVELNAAAGHPVSEEAGAGAAGGIGAGLLALGGRRESGAAVIAEHTRLADDVAAAELVITGEGRFDDQSLHGKVVSALAGAARSHHTPVLVLAGQVTLDERALRAAGITAAYSITDHAGSVHLAIDDAANQLAGLAQVTAAGWG
jgi:glycerate 2-kinase